MVSHYFPGGGWGWMELIEIKANSVQLQLQLPTRTELGKKKRVVQEYHLDQISLFILIQKSFIVAGIGTWVPDNVKDYSNFVCFILNIFALFSGLS